jgi:hypothetical protein
LDDLHRVVAASIFPCSGASGSGNGEVAMLRFGAAKLQPPTVDFLSVNEDLRRSADAEPNFVSVHGQDRNGNAAINDNLLADFP